MYQRELFEVKEVIMMCGEHYIVEISYKINDFIFSCKATFPPLVVTSMSMLSCLIIIYVVHERLFRPHEHKFMYLKYVVCDTGWYTKNCSN